jgi:hypothetical protein
MKYNHAQKAKWQEKIEKFAPKHFEETKVQLDEANAKIADFAANSSLFALDPNDLDKNEYLEAQEENLIALLKE